MINGLISLYFLPKEHILITAQASGEHTAFTFMDGFPEEVCPVSVINFLKWLLCNVAQNVIRVVSAKVNIAIVVDIDLAPGNNTMVPYRGFQVCVIGMGFFGV